MKVNNLIKTLLTFPNQEAEIKILIGNDKYDILEVLTGNAHIIIEGGCNKCTVQRK